MLKRFKKGSVDLTVAVALILPVVMLIIVSFVSFFITSDAIQDLQRFNYVAGRAAVSSQNRTEALEKATETYLRCLQDRTTSSHISKKEGDIEVKIDLLTDNGDIDNSKEWHRGNFVKITTSTNLTGVFKLSGRKTQTIIMMIEREPDIIEE